jgi:hypothetical protein
MSYSKNDAVELLDEATNGNELLQAIDLIVEAAQNN